jgi:hypothetical protein
VWFGTGGGADTAAQRLAMFFARADTKPGGGIAMLREALAAGEMSEEE